MESKELDQAMLMLDKVRELLLAHSGKMGGEAESTVDDMVEPDEMDDMPNSPSPYNAGNMRERSPFAKR